MAREFVKLKNGDIREVVKNEKGETVKDADGVMTVQDTTGVQTKITPEEIDKHITKWYEVFRLILQFASMLISAFKK